MLPYIMQHVLTETTFTIKTVNAKKNKQMSIYRKEFCLIQTLIFAKGTICSQGVW